MLKDWGLVGIVAGREREELINLYAIGPLKARFN